MAPPCCRCNASGRCKNCYCKKANKVCSNCQPLRLGNCRNTPTALATGTDIPAPPGPPAGAQANQALAASTDSPRLTDGDISTPFGISTPADSLSDDTANASLVHPVPTAQPTTPQQEDSSLQLPPFTPANDPVFTWGTYSAPDFMHSLEATYSEVVHWRRNCFTVPLGKAGKEFVDELSYLFQAFASASALESIALKSATILPILLLQKPHKASPRQRSTSLV